MTQVPMTANTDVRPVVYAGRLADRVAGADLPDDRPVLSEWDVLPSHLAAAMERAPALVILDPFSFPFEAMTQDQWDVPLVLALPSEFDAEFLSAVFGEALFERLGFFDRIATPHTVLWEDLRQRYGWTSSQRIEAGGDSPGEAAAEIFALLETGSATPDFAGDDHYEVYRYWSERGEALASSAPHRAVCSARHGLVLDKAMHRVQKAALEPQFAAVRGARVEGVPFDVLEVGVGVGRWAASFNLAKTRFVGVDISEGMVRAVRDDFPEGRFDHLGSDLLFPYDDESFDLVFTVDVLHHNPTPAKRTLLSEMWRVARPGGRLLYLEDFVAQKRSPRSTVYPMSVLKFAELVLEATAGQVVLEHVESLRYPRDEVVRGGLISLSKLGVPKRW
jgi:SAM-dependent methyltransferase